MIWLLFALTTPVVIGLYNGSTYTFAFVVLGLGILLYFINVFLLQYFIKSRASSSFEEDKWEATAGTGVVPKWVSILGLVGTGLIPSGLIIALLIWLDIINKAL